MVFNKDVEEAPVQTDNGPKPEDGAQPTPEEMQELLTALFTEDNEEEAE